MCGFVAELCEAQSALVWRAVSLLCETLCEYERVIELENTVGTQLAVCDRVVQRGGDGCGGDIKINHQTTYSI